MQVRTHHIVPAIFALGVVSAEAQSVSKTSLAGRYGLDKASCVAKDYFATVKETGFDLPVMSCKGVEFDQTESKGGVESYSAKAQSCIGEGQTKGRPAVFRVVRKSGTIQFFWSDGTKSGVLTRC